MGNTPLPHVQLGASATGSAWGWMADGMEGERLGRRAWLAGGARAVASASGQRGLPGVRFLHAGGEACRIVAPRAGWGWRQPRQHPSIRWELKGRMALRDSAIMLWVVNISLSFLKAKWLLPPEKYINGPSKTLP